MGKQEEEERRNRGNERREKRVNLKKRGRQNGRGKRE